MTLDATRLANPPFANPRAYDPGHDLVALRARFGPQLAELGANENPRGPGPAARRALQQALTSVHRYPDPACGELRRALAAELDVAPDELVFGNGSHELLMQLGQVFAAPGKSVVFSRYGFAVFPLSAMAAGAPAIAVPALPADHASAPLGHDLDAMAGAVREDTVMVFLANPNNPTGTWFDREALEKFLQAVPEHVLVVVDEAYSAYFCHEGGFSALDLRRDFPNLIVTRTFSKAHGLAGLRVGYLVAHASVCRVLEGVRENFNVGVLAQAAARASLADRDWLRAGIEANRVQRQRLADGLAARGWPSLPSRTNFLLVDCHGEAASLEAVLRSAGVVVRPVDAYGLPGYLRISVGSEAENQRLLEALP